MIINGFGRAFLFCSVAAFSPEDLASGETIFPVSFAGYEALGLPLPFPTFGLPSSAERSMNLQGRIHTFGLISDSLRSVCKLLNPHVMFIERRNERMT